MTSFNEQTLIRRAQQSLASGKPQETKSICEHLLVKSKNNADVLFLLSEACNLLSLYEDCIAHLRRCVAMKPRSVLYLLTLATRLMGRGDLDGAIATFKKAARVDPNCLDAIAGMALCHEMQGDFDAARQLLQPYIDANRENVWMAQVYATLELRAKRPQRAVEVLMKFAQPGAPAEVFFDLGKAYEKLHEYDLAFDAYQQGNLASRQNFNLETLLEQIRRTVQTFSPHAMKRLPRARHGSRLPLLVTSRPRSGTTLVERIICSHPQAHEAGELAYTSHLANRLNLEIGSDKVYPECAADMDQQDADRLGQQYIDYLAGLGGNAKRVVDKNMATNYHLGLINVIAPQSAAILCLRDPVDNCLSCFCEDIRHRHGYATDLRMLGITYETHMLLRQHWLATLDLPMLEVRYEDLVADQVGMTRKIISFCGLEWDDRCLRFHETKSETGSSAAAPTLSYDQVRQPIYKTSVGRAGHFAKHLDPLYQGFAEGRRIASELAKELGIPYVPSTPDRP